MTTHAIPNKVPDETMLERLLASPRPELVTDLRSWSGDLVVLGAGGKMGPSLAKLARDWMPQDVRVTSSTRSPDSPRTACVAT